MAPFAPEEYIQLSALQHYVYCPRQCALIHMDMAWAENVFTAQGRLLHEKADSGKHESRGSLRTVTGLLLRSALHGVSGKADVVEFHLQEGVWRPYPVEYKRGGPKKHDADRIQLCMQALCLEEMLGLDVPEGALFYGKNRRRQRVGFDAALRRRCAEAAAAVHALLEAGRLPEAANDERCPGCSLHERCMPALSGTKDGSRRYLASLLADCSGDGP